MSGETIAGVPSADPRVTASGPTASHRIQAAVAWIAWFIAVVSGTLGAVLVATDQATGHPFLEQTPVSGIAGTAIAVGYGSVGLLLVLRRPGLVIGWLFVGIGVVAGLSNYAWGYVGLGLTQGTAPGPFSVVEIAWLNNALTYSTWAALSFLLVLLFPDGRPLGPPWRIVVVAAIGVTIVLTVGLALEPGTLRLFETIPNPRPAPEPLGAVAEAMVAIGLVGLIAIGALSVWSLVLRYRRAGSTERRQLRWFAWGAVLTLAGGVVLVITALAVAAESRLTDLSWVIFACAAITLPIAAVIAILRERLYDIDRLISRTFVFGLLTAILAGLYSALIRLFNAVFVDVTHQSNELALVLTTLILATTFTPIKKRLEDIAEHRFRIPDDAPATAVDAGPERVPGPGADIGSMTVDELDRRFEAIARRVATEVLAESRPPGRSAPDGAAQDDQADQDQYERAEQVAEAGEARPQA